MALRDQPYLPLYVQDIMTCEKLNECCPATHGVYIKGIMCLMHKSEQYGKILLKQKDKQTDNQVTNFALKIDKHTPYSVAQIEAAINELIDEGVLYIDGDSLCQRRMIKDFALSEIRANAGKKGGDKNGKKRSFAKAKGEAKEKANSEYEYEYEIDNENEFKEEVQEEKKQKSVSREALNLVDEHCEYFSIRPIPTSIPYNSIYNFIETLFHQNNLKILKTSFESYKLYKAKSNEARHNVSNWIGSKENYYQDGQWIVTDWEAKNNNSENNQGHAVTKNRKQQHTTKLAASVAETYREVFAGRNDG
jgi:hypothetical protein